MASRVIQKSSIAITLFAGMTFVLAACGQTVSDDAKMKLSKDVECATAQQDIAALEESRASTLKQITTGAQYVMPPAVIINIFRSYNQDGTSEEFYTDREQVVTGEYNKSIEAKIEEIERICGV
jgi:hypothetical protein